MTEQRAAAERGGGAERGLQRGGLWRGCQPCSASADARETREARIGAGQPTEDGQRTQSSAHSRPQSAQCSRYSWEHDT